MNAYTVKFPATNLVPACTVTVIAETPADADQKALHHIRKVRSLPSGWTALSTVTPTTIAVGTKFNEVVR